MQPLATEERIGVLLALAECLHELRGRALDARPRGDPLVPGCQAGRIRRRAQERGAREVRSERDVRARELTAQEVPALELVFEMTVERAELLPAARQRIGMQILELGPNHLEHGQHDHAAVEGTVREPLEETAASRLRR